MGTHQLGRSHRHHSFRADAHPRRLWQQGFPCLGRTGAQAQRRIGGKPYPECARRLSYHLGPGVARRLPRRGAQHAWGLVVGCCRLAGPHCAAACQAHRVLGDEPRMDGKRRQHVAFPQCQEGGRRKGHLRRSVLPSVGAGHWRRVDSLPPGHRRRLVGGVGLRDDRQRLAGPGIP